MNFAQFGGAEPALAVETLRAAARHIRRGVVFTNGTVLIPEDVPYRLHISLWGLPEYSRQVRDADVVGKAMRNYADDPRAMFVFTINAQNIDDIPAVVGLCAHHGAPLTFSHFSPTVDYSAFLQGKSDQREFFRMRASSSLELDEGHLIRAQALIEQAMDDAPDTIVYSRHFNRWIHQPGGLFAIDPATGTATNCGSRVTKRYRHFHADMQDAGDVKCCAPNLDCRTCRIYAQSLSSALSRGADPAEGQIDAAGWIEMWDLWCRLFLNNWPSSARAEAASSRDATSASEAVCAVL